MLLLRFSTLRYSEPTRLFVRPLPLPLPQVEYGDAGLADLPARLIRFLPAKYSEATVRAPELANEIRKAQLLHAGKPAAVCETEYLAYVREWQVYGSSFFFVEPQMNVDMPSEVFLAVNPKGVLIINPETKEVLASHPYSEVPTWGHSGSSFVLHIGNLIKQVCRRMVGERRGGDAMCM